MSSDVAPPGRVAAVVDRCEAFRKELDSARGRGLCVGLVPTMGALHEGHGSLIRRSVAECDLTAVTIFVNPLQFDSADDLAAYPSDLEADLANAAAAGAGIVFAPPAQEMWPDGPPQTTVAVPALSQTLEGSARPGHLEGVATVVARLLNLAGPCRAYFGEKDFQQLAVVRALVHDLAVPAEVVACPTVREPDGLARSSRNVRLSAHERLAATALYRSLVAAADAFASGEHHSDALRQVMAGVLGAEALVRLDYVEVADPRTLEPVAGMVGADARLLVAAWLGCTRLIDNLALAQGERP